MLDPNTMQRLAFIKHLYTTAVRQSQQSEPLAWASILTFHDSVELFLHLASEKLNVSKRDIEFIKYWDSLSFKLPDGFPTQKESMKRLNKARGLLKHHGTMPSKLDIEAFRASVTSFFAENTPQVFGVDFEAISMVELVHCDETRESLKQAKNLQKQGNLEEAFDKTAIAFAQLIDDYENRNRSRFGVSPYLFGESFNFMDLPHTDRGFHDRVTRSIEDLRNALKIVSLGIDYRKYSKFRQLTPTVQKIMNGRWHMTRVAPSTSPLMSSENFKFCCDFVIESAIHLQEFDFEIE